MEDMGLLMELADEVVELKARVAALEAQSSSVTNTARFTPPAVYEVQDYMNAHGGGNASSFVNFYESKGWMVGKNKMKSWQAAARNWIHNSGNDKIGFKDTAATNRPSVADNEKNEREYRRRTIIQSGRKNRDADEDINKLLEHFGLDGI